MTEPVVAGVSAGDTRLPMVRWAAGEAGCRGTGLRLVTAHPAAARPGRHVALRLADLAAVAVAARPGLDVRVETVAGPAGAVLRDAAAAAELLVVGADDASPFTEAIVGSVPGDLLTTTPCPLAVVPRREWTTPASAPVVVAVDGPEISRTALAYAFAAAARTGRPLAVLRCPPAGVDPVRHDRVLTEVGECHPGVAVTTETGAGDSADALLAVSRHAAQLVLGSHGRGRLASGLFGSVSRILIRRAGCPVVVVRARAPAGGRGPAPNGAGRGAPSCAHGTS